MAKSLREQKVSTKPKNQNWKKPLWLAFRIMAVTLVLLYVFKKNGQGKILTALLSADPFWISLAALLFFVSIILGSLQWYLLLHYQGVDLKPKACFRIYYSGMFVNNFLPSTVGGDALRVYQVQKEGAWLGKTMAATFIDRLFGFCVLSLFSLVAVLVTLWQGTIDPSVFRHLFAVVTCVFTVLTMVLILLLSRRISGLLHRLIRRMGLRWLDETYTRVQAHSDAYRSQPAKMILVLALASVVQVLRIFVHWFSAIGLGLHIAPIFFFSFIPIIALAGVIPLNIGGWGIPQSLGAYLYNLPGVIVASSTFTNANAPAAALAFLPSVIGLVVMLGGGFYFIFPNTTPANEQKLP